MSTRNRFGISIILFFTLLFLVLIFFDYNTNFENPILLLILNTLFTGLIPIIVTIITARTYLLNLGPGVLLISCGMLAFGMGSILTGILRFLPESTNISVTLYNLCALIGAICNLSSSMLVNNPIPKLIKSKKIKLVLAISGICLLIISITIAVTNNLFPLFFDKDGSTRIRNIVILLSISLYFGASISFRKNWRKVVTDHIYWYSLSMMMLSIGLFIAFIASSVGSPLSWLGRFAQYFGSVFALISMLDILKYTRQRGASLIAIMSDFFADAESNYKNILEFSSCAMIAADQKFRIFFANIGAFKIFKYDQKELINSSILDLLAQPSKALIKNDFEQYMSSGKGDLSETMEMQAEDKNGKIFPVELTVTYRKLPEGYASIYTIVDITSRKIAEKKINRQNIVLKAINQVYESVISSETTTDLTKDCISIVERITKSQLSFICEVGENRILHNLAASDLALEEFCELGKKGLQRLSDNHAFHRLNRILLAEGKTLLINDLSDYTGTPEGHLQVSAFLGVPFKRGSQVIGMISVANREGGYANEDVEVLEKLTPTIMEAILHKRVAEKLRDSEERFKLFTDANPCVVMMKDKEGRYVYLNKAWEDTYGETSQNAIGRTDYDFLPAVTAEMIKNIDFEVMRTGKIIQNVEGRYLSGKTRYWQIVRFPIHTISGSSLLGCIALEITEQKNAGDALRQSESYLRAVIEGTNDFIFLKDRSGRYLVVNGATSVHLNIPVDEMLGKTSLEVFPDKELARTVMETDQRIMDLGREETVEEIVFSQTKSYTYLSTKTPWYNEKGEVIGIIGISRNITERKLAENALRESEYLLREIIEGTNDLIYLLDRDCRIQLANTALISAWGIKESQIIGKKLLELTDEKENVRSIMKIDQQIMNTGIGETVELIVNSPSGPRNYLSNKVPQRGTDGNVIGLIGISHDITERKRIENALRRSESLLRAIMEGTDEQIFLKDRYGRFVMGNAALCKTIGLPLEKIIGKTDIEIHQGNKNVKAVVKNDKIVLDSNQAQTFEQMVPTPDGLRTYLTNKSPWHDEQGNVIGIIGIAQDITDRKKMEQEILGQAQELERKNKLITDFFINISHEFKTPLSVLMLGLELVERSEGLLDRKNDLDIVEYIKIMKLNSYRLGRLVSNLLDITKLDAGFMEPNWEYINIIELIKRIAETTKLYAGQKNIKIDFLCPIKDKFMFTDSFMIERIILNLLSNAIKHTPAGGCILVNCRIQGGKVIISVKDNGEGIPDEKKSIIFDRFRQVDSSLTRSNEGCGIGLALTKSLIELLKGKIMFESTLGLGTEFTVELPILQMEDRKQNVVSSGMELNKRIQMEFSDIDFNFYQEAN